MVRASTNTGRLDDHYRSLLPPHGGSDDTYGGGDEDRREAVFLGTAM